MRENDIELYGTVFLDCMAEDDRENMRKVVCKLGQLLENEDEVVFGDDMHFE